MFLSDTDIKKALKNGEIVIRPFSKKQLSVASYDVTLDKEFQVVDRHCTRGIDPAKGIYPSMRKLLIEEGEPFILHPGENVLAKQREFVGVDDSHLILLSGKSSLARAGLVVHNTAMLFNPGHYFHPTFELVNTNNVPIILRPGMQIAQLLFAKLTSPVESHYKKVGRYDEKNSNHFVPPKK
jgi:dCTP deaminase